MAKLYTVAELLELADKSQLSGAVKGKITTLYPSKHGKSDQGEWRFQNLTIKDAAGDSIKVTLKNFPADAPLKWKGKDIQLVANKTKKGWFGLRMDENAYKGKAELVLTVTQSAEIICGNETFGKDDQGESQAEEPQDDAPEETPPPKKEYKLKQLPTRPVKPEPEEVSDGDSPENGEPEEDEIPGLEQPKPKGVTPHSSSNAGLTDSQKHVIELQKHLLRQATLIRLTASASLLAIVNFAEKHIGPVPEDVKKDYAVRISQEMCKTLFTTMYINIGNHDMDIARGNREGNTLNTPFVPAINKLNAEILAIENSMKQK